MSVRPAWTSDGRSVRTLLDLRCGDQVTQLLHRSLLTPVDDIVGRPSKRFRSQLVEFGARLAGQLPPEPPIFERCRQCTLLIELLHAGSLIIDDIEDESPVRRGQPTLQRKYGSARRRPSPKS